jgi:hypothetical protein
VENNAQRERLHLGVGGHSPKWGTQFPGQERAGPSARVFEELRERPQLCVRGGLTKGERTLREDWPVVDGGWRRAEGRNFPVS